MAVNKQAVSSEKAMYKVTSGCAADRHPGIDCNRNSCFKKHKWIFLMPGLIFLFLFSAAFLQPISTMFSDHTLQADTIYTCTKILCFHLSPYIKTAIR